MSPFRAVYRLYRAWCQVPALRLGQLLVNAISYDGSYDSVVGARLFNWDDERLIKEVEDFVAHVTTRETTIHATRR